MTTGEVGQGGSGRPPFDIARTSSRAIGFSDKSVSLADRAKEWPFLIIRDLYRQYPRVQVFSEIMMAWHLVALASFLMQRQPGTLAVLEIVLHPHSGHRAHTSEGINHHLN
jgi:hypothetical protein